MIKSKPALILEFAILCLIVPGYIILSRSAPYMFTFLWSATLYCFLIMRFWYFKDWHDIWRWDQVTWPHMKPILARFIIGVIGMAVFLWFYNPGNFFTLFKTRPEIIPWILFMYPVISALPQEFIFCNFFFRRYQPFFGDGWIMITASAVVFAYTHVLYLNPVAPVLSLAGGIIFAMTYRKHRSLALVTIEHALYGNALFLIGLGQYFYSGGVR